MSHSGSVRYMLPNLALYFVLAASSICRAQDLPSHSPLQGDFHELHKRSAKDMQAFLRRWSDTARSNRASRWQLRFNSAEAYQASADSKRRRLAEILGVADAREAFDGFEMVATTTRTSLVAQARGYQVQAVRWPVLDGVQGEGLLFEPRTAPRGSIVVIPDSAWSPEMFGGLQTGLTRSAHMPRLLVEAGFRVLVPVLLDRQARFSVTEDGWGKTKPLSTKIPHREIVQRMAYELGRTVTGFEVQKVLAAVDQFVRQAPGLPIAVAGVGEGGRVALYSAALDTRIQSAWIKGTFGPREGLWEEPLDRNTWSLLPDFSDAQTAWLIAPRSLIVDDTPAPEYRGVPPSPNPTPGIAAPGSIRSPQPSDVSAEFARAREVYGKLDASAKARLLHEDTALAGFLGTLGLNAVPSKLGEVTMEPNAVVDDQTRMQRQFHQMVEHCQRLLRRAEFRRREFWAQPGRTAKDRRETLWNDIIGRLPDPSAAMPFSARLRYDEPAWKGYEVELPVWEGVSVYGVLLVPKKMTPGERRPVVVAQHGLRGTPDQIVNPRTDSVYHHFGGQLADQGYVVFAPYGPHDGSEDFRVLTRMTNPLGLTIYSIITGQHQRILEWLGTLPFVDRSRIGLYGLSFGGKTAMRVPALLDGYAASICSGDFNDWILKNASSVYRTSTVYTHSWEIPEFNIASSFNYGEMTFLIAPRPFMVERGHHDTVAMDEWVASEYAKVRRHYVGLGIGDRTAIEFFDGPHAIHGKGTFEFLARHLKLKPSGN